jgi:molybdenum cofactor guanylyltransferase
MTSKKTHDYHRFTLAITGILGQTQENWLSEFLVLLSQTWNIGLLRATTTATTVYPVQTQAFTSPDSVSIQSNKNLTQLAKRQLFQECDLLIIVEDTPSTRYTLGEIRCLAPDSINTDTQQNQDSNWQASVYFSSTPVPQKPLHFHMSNLKDIKLALSERLNSVQAQAPFYGLLLAGGYSRRMKQDKALLNYHGENQLVHTYGLLSQVCEQVHISCRESQAEQEWPLEANLPPLPWFYDRFIDLGPIGGILTAMLTHPQAAWLVVAVDLPHLDLFTLGHLIQARHPLKPATAFISSHDGLPEPLCAIYEPHFRERLFAFLGAGISCPRKALIHTNTHLLTLPDPRALDNANTPQEFGFIQSSLAGLEI